MSDSDQPRHDVPGCAAIGAELLPPHTPNCMGCGPNNLHGMKLEVYRWADMVYADATFTERHVGAPGLAHGGAVAAACDDVLAFTQWIAGTPAVTRSLTVEYLLPAPLGLPHRITAKVTARDGRALHVSAHGVGADGVTRFTAQATFIVVTADHFAAHGDMTGFTGLFEQLACRDALSGEAVP